MKKLINKLRSKQSPGDGQKILINGIIEASRKYPNDMDLGRCVRYFLFECTEQGDVSQKDMYEIMQKAIEQADRKQHTI